MSKLKFVKNKALGNIGFYIIHTKGDEVYLTLEHKEKDWYYSGENISSIQEAEQLANDIEEGKINVEWNDLSKEAQLNSEFNSKWVQENIPELIKKLTPKAVIFDEYPTLRVDNFKELEKKK